MRRASDDPRRLIELRRHDGKRVSGDRSAFDEIEQPRGSTPMASACLDWDDPADDHDERKEQSAHRGQNVIAVGPDHGRPPIGSGRAATSDRTIHKAASGYATVPASTITAPPSC